MRAHAFALLAAAAASSAPSCTFIADVDYVGEPTTKVAAPNATACCALCAAAGAAACWASVFRAPTGCWFKTQPETQRPAARAGNSACWPAGRPGVPSASATPAPPLPPAYAVAVVSLPPAPVISFLAGQTPWPQSFNPSFVEPSAGTRGVRGLLVRSQNCSLGAPGTCLHCNPRSPTDVPFLGSVIAFAAQAADGSFGTPYLVYAPEPGNAAEAKGTEDPRLKYDAATGLYHLFYTCFGAGGGLCHSTTRDPTAPHPGAWTRHGVMWPGKSAALLIRPAGPPHYLYQGDTSIALWKTDDLFNFTLVARDFIAPRDGEFDSGLVEAGPPPLALSTGDYIFFFNSADGCYHAEYAILSGADPTVILQRAAAPLLSPTRDWERGAAPAECNVACVVFLEAAAPVDGQPDVFDVWFGGSDAVVGTARVSVKKV